MKRMATLMVVLLLGGATLQAAGPMMAQTGGPGPGYSVQAGTAAGGGYQVTSLRWHVSGAASGEGYHLLSPAAPTSSENGCCCTYLPCILRNY